MIGSYLDSHAARSAWINSQALVESMDSQILVAGVSDPADVTPSRHLDEFTSFSTTCMNALRDAISQSVNVLSKFKDWKPRDSK